MSEQYKYVLSEQDIPETWYNINPDMPIDPAQTAWNAVLHPGTKEPVTPDFLSVLFPMRFIGEAVSMDRWIEIPEPVRDIYKLWRPTPMFRARRLEQALDTPAHIYYKYEGVSPVGSHKPNTAVAQAFYAKEEGVTGFTTETGAGQWGSALSMACNFFNLECHVYMVKVSYHQKPYRRILIESYGASVTPSPSEKTQYGKKVLAEDPDSPGSLGIAISEAIERAVQDETTKYALGSVLNHVLLHQTIVGQEALKQFEIAGDLPDIIIAPFGGGSNFAGLSFPFLRLNFDEGKKIRAIASEPSSCPKLTRGQFRYDFGDTIGMTPLLPMYTLGHNFIPAPIHAGGLRYHGAGVIVSQLLKDKLIEARSHNQIECFEAGVKFAKAEAVIPAPEANHGIATAIQEAERCKEEGISRTILFNLCGHGNFDMSAYESYFSGKLVEHELTEVEILASLAELDTPTID